MGLAEYKRKRDFKATPEPPGMPGARHKSPLFVVQEHHASTHHYDFRLEADGVLKSWAVPKGPSMSPADKRLAVEVEDHPLSYATFHGDIPPGHYGAGHVDIWDHGTYTPESPTSPKTVPDALDQGRLTFTLHGRKLKGSFSLIRTRPRGGKPQWLLIKRTDRYARPSASSESPPLRGRSPSPVAGASRPRPPRHDERHLRHSERSEESQPSKRRTRATSPKITTSKSKPQPIELTHPDKLLYPQANLTKQDIADYYRRIAHAILPYLRNRPVTLERFPAGVSSDSPHFWQKNLPPTTPDWIPRVAIPSETGKPVTYPLINDIHTLLYFVNQNALTFHIYLSRVDHLDRPDFLLFDLDPGRAPWKDLITLAQSLHKLLDSHDVPSYLKTSGKSGLHILTPPPPHATYDTARSWAEQIAADLANQHPTLATTERTISKRNGRIYIDYIQNALGHHLVSPYSLRPTPTATVSTPLSWSELTPKLNPAKFTAKTLPRRLSTKPDPMADLLRESDRK